MDKKPLFKKNKNKNKPAGVFPHFKLWGKTLRGNRAGIIVFALPASNGDKLLNSLSILSFYGMQ